MKTITPSRKARLAAISAAHDEWVEENFTKVSDDFNPAAYPKPGSDYNQHNLDVDAPGALQDEFAELVGAEVLTAAGDPDWDPKEHPRSPVTGQFIDTAEPADITAARTKLKNAITMHGPDRSKWKVKDQKAAEKLDKIISNYEAKKASSGGLKEKIAQAQKDADIAYLKGDDYGVAVAKKTKADLTKQLADTEGIQTKAAEWREWAKTAKSVTAYTVPKDESGTGKEKVGINLPDASAYVFKQPGTSGVQLRDVETDEMLFKGTSMPDLWRKVSKFYGVPVVHIHEGTLAEKSYGEKGDPFKSPASAKYGPLIKQEKVSAPAPVQAPKAEPEKFKILPREARGKSGDGYVGPGIWGKYGAAGLMLRHVDKDGTERFMLVQNILNESQMNKWQLPGGAIDEKETPHQGAAREVWEELGLSQEYMAKFEEKGVHAVDVPIGEDKPWTYSNIAVDVPFRVTPDFDKHELGGVKWVTAEELDDMKDKGELVAPFAANLDSILQKFHGGGTPVPAPVEAAPPKISTAPKFTTWKVQKGTAAMFTKNTYAPGEVVAQYSEGGQEYRVWWNGKKFEQQRYTYGAWSFHSIASSKAQLGKVLKDKQLLVPTTSGVTIYNNDEVTFAEDALGAELPSAGKGANKQPKMTAAQVDDNYGDISHIPLLAQLNISQFTKSFTPIGRLPVQLSRATPEMLFYAAEYVVTKPLSANVSKEIKLNALQVLKVMGRDLIPDKTNPNAKDPVSRVTAWLQTAEGKEQAIRIREGIKKDIVPHGVGNLPTQFPSSYSVSEPELVNIPSAQVDELSDADARDMWEEMTDDAPLSSAAQNAAYAYGESPAEINELLQGNLKPEFISPDSLVQTERLLRSVRPASQTFKVYRDAAGIGPAINQHTISNLASLQKYVGAVVKQNSFLSTSLGRDNFGDRKFEMVITVPEGTPVLYMAPYVPSQFKSEREMLLGAGLNYRIDKVEERENEYAGTYRIYATVVPEDYR